MKIPMFASLIVGLLAALVLAACGDSSDSKQPVTTGSTAAVAPTTGADPPSGGTVAPEGGTDGTPPPSDSEQVAAAIEALLTDPDNEFVCDQVLSEKLLRTAYGDRQGCRDQRQPEVLSDGVKINDLKLDGQTATAVAIPKRGFYDGQKLDVVAVREGETWRIQQFISNVPVGP